MDQPENLAALRSAIQWGLSEDRAAWSRTVESVAASEGSYRIEDVEAAKAGLLDMVKEILPGLLDAMVEKADASAPSELEGPPERTWQSLLAINRGVFATPAARELLARFVLTIASTVPGQGPLYMSPMPDGWGALIRPAHD